MQKYHPLRNCFTGVLILLAPAAYAVDDGFYMGIGAGQSTVYAPGATINGQHATAGKSGMGGRIFMGGQFNSHGAFEVGYTHYAAASYNVKSSSGSNPELRTSAIDFSFHGILPLAGGFSVFGAPGLALAHASGSGSLSSTGGRGPTSTSVRPRAGVGVSYDINQSWVADVSMQRLFGSGVIRTSSLLALSISYHIVDKKCGEFLC